MDLDLNETHRDLFYSVAVPIPCLILASAYLIMAYKCIYNKKVVKKVSVGGGGVNISSVPIPNSIINILP